MEPVHVPLEANRPGKPSPKDVRRYLEEFALIDVGDADRVLSRRWKLHRARSGLYVCEVGHGGDMLHRFILELPRWKGARIVVDHINHDTLDNRRANLRVARSGFNLANSGSRGGSYSQFKGVSFDRGREMWMAQITVNQVHRHLGRFKEERDAALAYNKAALEAWGEFAHLNDVGS